MEPNFIDTTAALKTFLDDLGGMHCEPPRLYMDLEGNNLSRTGTLSLITILLEPTKVVYLIDVTTLGRDAFTTANATDRTLKLILESPNMIKVFFDVRNDSDALFSLYNIRVAGVEDLQLMELASRNFSKRVVNCLAKCIEQDATVAFSEKKQWRAVKDKGRSLFAPERGGSYTVFDQRPLSEELRQYCAQDVILMPLLRKIYREKLCDAWWRKIEEETHARIRLSQSLGYNGKGRHMALGPVAWLSWTPSPSERHVRTLFQNDNDGIGTRESNSAHSTYVPIDDFRSSVTTSMSSQPTDGNILTTSLREIITARASPDSIDDDEDDDDADFLHHDDSYEHQDDSDSPRDFTACDIECGYCGHCDY